MAKLPADHHVARYVRKNQLRRDEYDNVLGVLPQAFERRENEEYLSATWLEHFSAIYQDGLSAAVAAMRRQLQIKKGDGFTVGRVGGITEVCESFDVRVRVLHEPDPRNKGHSAIRGIPRDNQSLLALLADEVFTDTRIAATFPDAN